MDLGLTGRIALVVGGTGFIGAAVTARLRAEGAVVATAARSGADVRMDATDGDSVRAGVDRVLRKHGAIDVLVVAAAPPAGSLDPATLSDPDVIPDAVAAKAMAFLRLAQAVLPAMRERGFGRVIGISGQNAYLTGNILGSVRNATLIIAAKNLADEYAGTGVTVNAVNPGGVADHPSATVDRGKPGQSSPDQIAALIAFLASDAARAISGESISIGHKLRGIATT